MFSLALWFIIFAGSTLLNQKNMMLYFIGMIFGSDLTALNILN